MKGLLLCASAFGLAAGHAAAADDPAQSLIRAAESSREVTYQAVAVYRGDGDRFEVLKVQHRFQGGSERERIVTMTGDPVQLLRTDDRIVWILPKGQTMSRDRPSLKGVLNQLNADRVHELASWYTFEDEGGGRIADRLCTGVMVAPRDAYRYGYEVWYDKDTHIPLKISLVGSHGEMLEQLMFTEVSFPKSIPDEAFETEVDTSKFNLVAKNITPSSAAIDELPSQVNFSELPPGFKVVVREHRPLPNGQTGQMEHLLLSDGLASVSVFSAIRAATPDKGFRGISEVGGVQAYGRTAGGYHITIVGEVPSTTVRMIGDNLSPVLTSMVPPPAVDQAP